MKRPGSLLLAFLVLLGANLAHGGVGLRLYPQREAYLPGEEVWIEVSQEALVVAEEFELLLHLPSLTLRQLRLTPSVAAQRRWLRLTVPHLPWTRACLVLRAGQGGREWEAARSPVFLVLPNEQRGLPGWRWVQGEWWLHEWPGFSHLASVLPEAFQQGQPPPLPLPASAPRSSQSRVQKLLLPSRPWPQSRRQPHPSRRLSQPWARVNPPLRE